MDMYERWSDPEFSKHHLELNKWEWKDYDDFVEKYGSTKNPERYLSFTTIGRFFEGLGVLVKRKLIDPYLVDDLMSSDILEFWEKFEPFILERRIQTNTPQVWEYVEYLYNTIKPIVESQHPELKT